jgi:GNAT superfamily N-acetyltransferase
MGSRVSYVERLGLWLDETEHEAPCRRCGRAARLYVAETETGRREGPWCELACFGSYHDERARLHGRPRVNDRSPVAPWARIAERWPATGELGITQTRDGLGDVLTYRDAAGHLRGILWHRPTGIGVLVDPAYRRRGVGLALVRAAGRRWPINLAQPMTDAGVQLSAAAVPRYGRARPGPAT